MYRSRPAPHNLAWTTLEGMSAPTTTPVRLRLPVLVLLAGVALYLLLGAHSAVQILSGQPPGADPFWLGRFKMFTDLRPHHTALVAEVRQGGAWRALALEEAVPSSWQEGPGYNRSSFYRHPDRLAALAAAVCEHAGAEAVRLGVTRWEKTLGSAEQPPTGLERRALLEVGCAP